MHAHIKDTLVSAQAVQNPALETLLLKCKICSREAARTLRTLRAKSLLYGHVGSLTDGSARANDTDIPTSDDLRLPQCESSWWSPELTALNDYWVLYVSPTRSMEALAD